MATSLQEKHTRVLLKNSRRNITGGAASPIGIPIDRDGGLMDEYHLKITVSANFTVAPTGVDVRQFIDRINLRSNFGDIIKSLSGQQMHDLVRLTEKTMTPILTPGAGAGASGNVVYSLTIPRRLIGAYYDHITSERSSDLSKLDLEIVTASAAKIGAKAFVGATLAGAPNILFTVDPELQIRPGMEARGDVGLQINHYTSREETGTVTGTTKTFELDGTNMTRFIGIHADDVSGGADAATPSNSIITGVRLVQGSRVLLDTDFASLRFFNQRKRDVDITGFAAIDFGNQNSAFAELGGSPVHLAVDIAAGAPTWRVQISQNYVRGKSGV